MPQYKWDIAKFGIKHQSMNQIFLSFVGWEQY
jgi:hypothetical protein